MQTFETPGAVLLRVSIPAGEVTVETGAAARVEVEVVPLRNNDASRQAAEETRVEAVERRGRHEIVVEAPKRRVGLLSFGRDVELGVRLTCPEGSDLDVSTASADLETRGRLGAVTAKNASGDVEVDVAASLAVNTASGDVAAGEVAGDVAVKTASGDIEVRSAGGTTSVNAVSGDIRLGEANGRVNVNSVSGDVEVDALAGDGLNANTVSGDISIGVVPGLPLWIDAHSVSGSTSSDLDLGDEAPSPDDSVVELRARSVSGDVRIARARVRA